MARRNTARPPGGLPDKRRAILAGALAEFARDGYTRASIDAIAARAGVSTRTIYNHFQDKSELFQHVIQESAAAAAEAQVAIIDRYLRKVTDLEADLMEFGRALVAPMPDYADHFALVRQIRAEAQHIPPPAVRAWQEAGPLRVRRELAHRLEELADRGLLQLDDPDQAALHLMRLVSVAAPPNAVPPDEEIAASVTAGVLAFLYGYSVSRDTRPDSSQHLAVLGEGGGDGVAEPVSAAPGTPARSRRRTTGAQP